MERVLFDIKDLLTDIKSLLQEIAENNVDVVNNLSKIAGKGIYNLDDIGKAIDNLAQKQNH
ncbi:MAG: hypothetical protein IJV77_05120 [Clostridia bacterium]|nr:hypothetical protein [Clostridia bacterium]